ncbi:MAG: helix-turn-helix domain-containing protein [Gammaproteobacteria bacterium]|nr:helix-turn-helix domain-containing protein [Gammaproteobacteria bacterium]
MQFIAARLQPPLRDSAGITPHEFVQHARLKTSRDLLMFTKRSVEDICHEVGYDDAGTFCKLFRRARLSPRSTTACRGCRYGPRPPAVLGPCFMNAGTRRALRPARRHCR